MKLAYRLFAPAVWAMIPLDSPGPISQQHQYVSASKSQMLRAQGIHLVKH